MKTNTTSEGVYTTLKSQLNFLFLVGMLLLVSCSGDKEIPGGDPGNGEKPAQDLSIRFSSGLSGWVTRAANGSWDADDRVGVYMVPHAAAANLSTAYTGAANAPYVISGSGASASLTVAGGAGAITYPADGSKVNFVAYYPYKSDVHTTGGNMYKVDVSNQSPSKAIDLLYHKGAGTAYDYTHRNVSLAFTHQLSKIRISLTPASGVEVDLTGATVTLSGFPTTADFALSSGALSNWGGETKPVTPVKDAASSGSRAVFEAIVIPHSGASYTRSVVFTIGGRAYVYPLSDSDAFEAGVARDCGFAFTGEEVELTQNTIVDWEGGGTVQGDYLLMAGPAAFDLNGNATSGRTVTIRTDAPSAPAWTLSNDAHSNTTDVPDWITGASLSAGVPDGNGWTAYTLTFGATTNAGDDSRTGYIRLEVAGSTLAIRVTQTIPQANCYIVAPGGSVKIPITRAITIGGLSASATATVETLWDDNAVINGAPTLSGSGASRTITVRASAAQGNAVIALKSGGTIYWSWHIWVVNYNPNTGATWTNNGYTFMDRNLGATDNQLNLASRGLFYQWGRKDPFPGGTAGTAGYAALSRFKGMSDAGSTAYEYVTNTSMDDAGIAAGILESIRKPTTFFRYRNTTYWDWLPKNEDTLWNPIADQQPIYDPCPLGWRVPTGGDGDNALFNGLYTPAWYNTSTMEGADWGPSAKYPTTGYINGSGSLSSTPAVCMWCTTTSSHDALCHWIQEHASYVTTEWRCYGAVVRCVKA
jgi:hypothetical protein